MLLTRMLFSYCRRMYVECVQSFFEAHEADAMVLKHDKQLTKQPQRMRHLRHLPDYLKPGGGGVVAGRGSIAQRSIKRKLRPQDDPLKVRSACFPTQFVSVPCQGIKVLA
jgi:hypothetical protein